MLEGSDLAQFRHHLFEYPNRSELAAHAVLVI